MRCSLSDISKMLSHTTSECDVLSCGYRCSHIVSDDEITILLTDSRSLSYPATTLFFALHTKGNDGHRYIRTLYNEGVRNFVVTEIPKEMKDVANANFIIVDDTLAALHVIALQCRSKSSAKVVAIAGSRGKTTLKEWLYQILNDDYATFRSPRSYNSQIGVPLSVWEIEDNSQIAIIEAGISQPGEMQKLQNIIRPEIVILTNLSDERGDRFVSLRQKAEELMCLAIDAKILIYNADDALMASVAAKSVSEDTKLLAWSKIDDSQPLFISSVEPLCGDSTRISYRYNDAIGEIIIPFSASHDIENAINSLALSLLLFSDTDLMANRIARLTPVGTRLDVSEGVNGCSIIYDTYTADINSLWQALDFMGRRATSDLSRTLILSDMGHASCCDDELYPKIAELCGRVKIDRFIGIGPQLSLHKYSFGPESLFFASTDEFMQSMSTSDFSNELILLKGAPAFDFKRIQENLEARKHETVLEVNLDAVVKNFNYFRQQLPTGTGIVAMVKASGYGAGSYEIAKTLQAQGAAYLAVAVLDEGIDLRKAGITMPIMVMNPKVVNYKSMFAFRLEPEIYSLSMLYDVIREAEKNGVEEYPVHIKLDTGMHRMGFVEDELPKVMEVLNAQNYIVAKSVFSHLATADCLDMDQYTLSQIERFERLTSFMQSNYDRKILRHILNSAGILRFPQYHFDMARLGIGLYGANTLPADIEQPLAVVSSLKTVVIAIREWNAGESIGYGRRGILTKKSRIATIPIGYADGMNRRFGNARSRVYINGHYAPTVGNICMDACMIDVTDIPCNVGDIVEIFGENVSVQELADVLETIPYEVLTSISPRVKRIYFRE